MSKIILHIGLHKTGSSYLQQCYFPSIPGLTFFNRGFFNEVGTKELSETFLISGEGMSGSPWNDSCKSGIKNGYQYLTSFRTAIVNLKTLFPEANIMIVFRKHGDWVISLYKQYIQEGGVLSFEEFYGEGGIIKHEDLNFTKRIEFLYENFSKVDVLNFENFKVEGRSYFDRYFTSLGYGKSNLDFNQKTNRGISGKKVEMLRRINIFYPKVPKVIKGLLSKNGFTPRDIFQSRLRFWKSKNSEEIVAIQEKINLEFQKDWKYVEDKCWK